MTTVAVFVGAADGDQTAIERHHRSQVVWTLPRRRHLEPSAGRARLSTASAADNLMTGDKIGG